MGIMQPTNLRFSRLVRLVLLVSLASLALGVYPTYRWSGWTGLLALAVAQAIVVAVMLGSGAATQKLIRSTSMAVAGQAYMAGSIVRAGLSVGLALAAWATFSLSLRPLLFWVAVLYCLMLMAEVWWLIRGLMPPAGSQATKDQT